MMIVEKLLTTPIDIWILADVESKTTGLSKKLDKRTVGNGSCEDWGKEKYDFGIFDYYQEQNSI